MRVLLVDDNERIRKVLNVALDLEGFEVLQASNGEEAIEILTDEYESIDVVVLDLQMPVTNGWETLRVIKDQENGFPGPIVIMLTVQGEPENALKSWLLGAKYFMTKPVSIPTLVDTIQKAVREKVSGLLTDG